MNFVRRALDGRFWAATESFVRDWIDEGLHPARVSRVVNYPLNRATVRIVLNPWEGFGEREHKVHTVFPQEQPPIRNHFVAAIPPDEPGEEWAIDWTRRLTWPAVTPAPGSADGEVARTLGERFAPTNRAIRPPDEPGRRP